ncbi:MAG: hypothetical protein WBQ85_11470 [Candidatus Sulfotelmatobacter sp.]
MVNPISPNINHASEAAKPAAPKPQPQQQTIPLPSDIVTLKSAGNVPSGDNR